MSGRARAAAIACALLGFACKKAAPPSDAGVAEPGVEARPAPVTDPLIGVELSLPSGWTQVAGADAGLPEGWIVDARRRADPAHPSRVAPRLVLSRAPLERWLELETLLDRALADIRQIEQGGRAKIDRTSKGRIIIDGVELGELRVDYRVLGGSGGGSGGGGEERSVTQRTLVTQRFAPQDRTFVFDVHLTYLSSDEEQLGRELDGVLRSIRFRTTEVTR
ncbi:MAG: hypothetical protein IT384_26845 [Deltaproteobacteria bacterium]|nr:hypothetical protein [Deltaproteobacteria bacterium]